MEHVGKPRVQAGLVCYAPSTILERHTLTRTYAPSRSLAPPLAGCLATSLTQDKIVFCKPKDLHKWISEEALPTYWGGKDATVYSPKYVLHISFPPYPCACQRVCEGECMQMYVCVWGGEGRWAVTCTVHCGYTGTWRRLVYRARKMSSMKPMQPKHLHDKRRV